MQTKGKIPWKMISNLSLHEAPNIPIGILMWTNSKNQVEKIKWIFLRKNQIPNGFFLDFFFSETINSESIISLQTWKISFLFVHMTCDARYETFPKQYQLINHTDFFF